MTSNNIDSSINNVLGPSLTLSSSDHLTANLENLSLSNSFGTPAEIPAFVRLDSSCYCIHCKNVVSDALQLLCGHHVCAHCLNPLFGDQEVKICPMDDCGFQINKLEVFPDAFKRREVLSQKVFCTFKSRGCDAVVTWKDLQNHLLRCAFALFRCIHASDGCPEWLSRDQYNIHIKEGCDFLPVTCNNCQQITRKGRFQMHISNDCPKVMISCPYQCGAPQFLREQLGAHSEQCSNKPSVCSFSCIGCTFKGMPEKVKQHEKDDLATHLLLLSKYTSTMERQNVDILTELSDLKKEKDKWQQQALDLEDKLNVLKKDNIAAKKSGNELKLLIASHGERVIGMDRKVEDRAAKSVADNLVREVIAIKETNQALSARVTNLERAGPIVGEMIGPGINKRCSIWRCKDRLYFFTGCHATKFGQTVTLV